MRERKCVIGRGSVYGWSRACTTGSKCGLVAGLKSCTFFVVVLWLS